ncbi:hypothetical protein SBDP2_190007 [Syntrophobacter sp. SbD2]|nr:hypothetical protein SBDP2_190007 [Syntrophobacter sp. SbD2]
MYLNPGETKHYQAGTVYFDSEFKEVFAVQWEIRKKSGRLIPFVFTNESGKDNMRDFRSIMGYCVHRSKDRKMPFP